MIFNLIVRDLHGGGRRLLTCAGLLLLVFSLCLGTLAQAPTPATPAKKATTEAATVPTQPAGTPEMTAADVSAFLDGIMPEQLAREDIAGAVVLVIKDGKVLFTKGYGYADVAKKIPVTPDGTLFRPGSVSKLFTWTAVMQLVEQGKLDLDRDVNDYLDFKIPATFPKPITLRNIMTHAPGFQETVKDMWLSDPKDLVPIGDYVKAHIPARIFPPGVTPAYSNYATTVAGYIVERVSGEHFDDYIEHHILVPLGMLHSTFREPLPDALKPMMSCGYTVASEPAKPFEVIEPAPAGSSSMTAMDISHFMLAHLQDGTYENAQILRPETVKLMHTRTFVNLPDMNGFALGFYEESRNGHRIIGHAGDTIYFHSDLHLIPDVGVGFFVSYNSMGKAEISPRDALWHQFLDRYFPYQPPPGVAVANAAQDASDVSGSYIVSRRMETSMLAVFTPLGELKVSPGKDNTIVPDKMKDLNGKPKHFKEIGPLLFREVDGQAKLAFKRDDSGNLVMVIDYPFMVFQQASWYRSGTFNMIALIGALSVFVLTLLLWPTAYFVRRHYGQPLNLKPPLGKLRTWTRVVCAVDIIFVGIFVTIVLLSERYLSIFSSRMDIWFHLLQLLGGVGILGGLIILWNAVESWRYQGRGLWSRLGDTLIVVAALGFTWFVLYWHMLHWDLNY